MSTDVDNGTCNTRAFADQLNARGLFRAWAVVPHRCQVAA